MGSEIVKAIEGMDYDAEIILQHYEKLNGSGYPRGLNEQQILTEAKIIAVADNYDALISDRIYRKGFSHNEALKIIMSGKD